jgi:hypothetical protein
MFPSSSRGPASAAAPVDERWDDPVRLARLADEVEGELAGLSPEERFEREFGVEANPDAMAAHGRASGGSAEERAVALQDELMQLDRVLRIAEAKRIEALVLAYEASMTDLGERFGSEYGTRGGRGASVFFTSVALRTQQNPLHVAHLVDTAITARDRLPRTWAEFRTGAVAWRRIDTAVQQAQGLDPDRWAAYDDVAAKAVATSNRLKDVLRRTRERLQDDTAAQRARTTFQRRAVHLDPGPDGGSTWSMVGPAEEQTGWDAALTRNALAWKRAGDDRTVAQLRYDIARDLIVEGLQRDADPAAVGLAVPGRKGVQVQVVVTVPVLAWLGHSTEQAQLAGYGPIAMSTAKDLAARATSMLRVLTDPVTGARLVMDRTVYSPPADLRRWLTLRDRWCRFPGCRRPAELCDTDHLREWQHGGTTDADNLLSECRRHHAAKSVQLWQAELDSRGSADWTGPWGEHFTDPPVDPMDPAPPDLSARSDPDEPPPF